MRTLTNIYGRLCLPYMQILLNGTETICLNDDDTLVYVLNCYCYNPNDKKTYKCDVVFHDETRIVRHDIEMVNDKVKIRDDIVVGATPDKWGRYFDLVVKEEVANDF